MLCFELPLGAIVGRSQKLNKLPRVRGGSYLNRLTRNTLPDKLNKRTNMNIIIRTKDCELTPTFKEFIEEKIGSLEKYSVMFQEDVDHDPVKQKAKVEAIVEIGKSTLHHRKGDNYFAECHLVFPRKTLTASAASEDFKSSIIEVREELQRQITDYKDKMIELSRKP